jgi:hypothetical protein
VRSGGGCAATTAIRAAGHGPQSANGDCELRGCVIECGPARWLRRLWPDNCFRLQPGYFALIFFTRGACCGGLSVVKLI